MVVKGAFDVALNLSQATAQPYGVFSIVSSQNASMVYVDQKYNGYTFNPNTFTGYDAVFILNMGGVLTLDNWAAPYWEISPSSSGQLLSGSLGPVDGGDYFFIVGGPVNVVRGFTDRQAGTGPNGTYVAEMTEVYPVEEGGENGGRSFIMPVGEDTYYTADFNGTYNFNRRGGAYAIVQAYYDNTVINYTLQGVAQPAVTLGRGESMVIPHVFQRDTIASSKKIQVVLFGSGGLYFDTRLFNIPDTHQGGNDYWIPTYPSEMNATIAVRYHIFALTDAHVTIESSAGAAYGWNGRLIPALSTDASFITNGTVPLHIFARQGERFIVLVSVDTSGSSYDWGYVPKDSTRYVNSYFIPYAPSGLGSPSDMQLFVLPLYDRTTIYVDFNQDGAADASKTLDRFQAHGFYNPSALSLTGAHIYSDFPFTVVYGESPLADAGGETPGYDWGYTLLPFDYVNYESVLRTKVDVDLPVVNPGTTVRFTITVESTAYTVHDVDVYNLLPPGFTYVPGTATITRPGSPPSHSDPTITGQLLLWDLSETLGANSTLSVTFSANVTGSIGYYENLAYVSATDPWGNKLAPDARAYVTVSAQSLIFGYIYDPTGTPKPIPGVRVFLHDGTDTLVGTALTDGNGLFKFLNLSAGTYRVSYDTGDPDLAGFWPLSDSDPALPPESPLTSSALFELPSGESRTHNFTLSRAFVLMDKQASPDPASRGDEVRFTIHYSVPAWAPSTVGNTLVDELGPFMVYKVGSLALNGTPLTDALDSDAGDFGGSRPGAVTVNLGALAPGASGTVAFTATISSAFPASTVSNTAIISNAKDGPIARASSTTAVTGAPPISEYVNITGLVLNTAQGYPSGVYNLTVLLYSNAGLVASTRTTVEGNYSFPFLSTGTYTVNYSLADPAVSLLFPTSDTDGGAPNSGKVNATAPFSSFRHDFNLTNLPRVGGLVFVDWNLDGTMGEGETPFAGATVRLTQGGSVIREAITQADGAYSFDALAPGDYVASINATELYPYRPSSDSDGGLPSEGNLALAPGATESHSFALALRLPGINVSKVVVADWDDCVTPTGIVCGSVQFNITVSNIGNATLAEVALFDIFNATAFTFVSAAPAPSFVDNATGTLLWGDLTTGGMLPPGSSITVLVSLRSITEVPANSTMNTATASAYDAGHQVSATASALAGPLEGRACGSLACDLACALLIITAIIPLLLLLFLYRRKKRKAAEAQGTQK